MIRSSNRSRIPGAHDRKVCEQCGDAFRRISQNGKSFCSQECLEASQPPVVHEPSNRDRGIPTGTTGAAVELLVASQLMLAGWHVFRSLSPCAPFDLVAFKDGTTMRLEVKGRKTGWSDIQAAATHVANYDPLTGSVRYTERANEQGE